MEYGTRETKELKNSNTEIEKGASGEKGNM
jgi:hypothetical protein